MKLPLDYKLTSLRDLHRVVALIGTGGQIPQHEKLEMTKDQYGKYKQLIYSENAICYYNGMEIEISTEVPSTTSGSSV